MNHDQKSLNECNDKNPNPQPNLDPPQGFCENPDKSLRDHSSDWLDDISNKKIGLGSHNLCDPMQTGQIFNDVNNPTRNQIYRYNKSLRGTHEAVKDLFSNILVADEDGKEHRIPIIIGRQERAVAIILQDNVRKDETLVVDRIRLPFMSLWPSGYSYDIERYTYHRAKDFLRGPDGKPGFLYSEKHDKDTVLGRSRGIPVNVNYDLYVWTAYLEDIDQIFEQIITKFSPFAYIKIRGIHWPTQVKLDGIQEQTDTEPGDQKIGIVKRVFNLTAETYIAQPLYRYKTVKNTVVDIYNSVNEEEIVDNYERLEETVRDIESD